MTPRPRKPTAKLLRDCHEEFLRVFRLVRYSRHGITSPSPADREDWQQDAYARLWSRMPSVIRKPGRGDRANAAKRVMHQSYQDAIRSVLSRPVAPPETLSEDTPGLPAPEPLALTDTPDFAALLAYCETDWERDLVGLLTRRLPLEQIALAIGAPTDVLVPRLRRIGRRVPPDLRRKLLEE